MKARFTPRLLSRLGFASRVVDRFGELADRYFLEGDRFQQVFMLIMADSVWYLRGFRYFAIYVR